MDKIKLTQAQRRIIVEHFAEQCAQDVPAQLTGLELEHHLEWWRLKLALAMDGRKVDEIDWSILTSWVLDFQSFDRDPAGWLNEQGYDDSVSRREHWHDYLNDEISARINLVAG